MEILSNIWWYLVLIGVMILVHELGHYWAARFFDIHVEAFSFGFGPRLFGFRRGETDFRVCAIPFGGYVKMAGEHAGEQPGEAAAASDPRGFNMKPRWQRLIVVFAGPAINIVLAVALLTGLFMARYPKVPTQPSPYVGYVAPGGAAEKAGIREGDRVVQINGKSNPTWEDIALLEVTSASKPMEVAIVRGGERLVIPVTPVLDAKQNIGVAGWTERAEIQVSALIKGMGAEKAGLQRGDVILKANGEPVNAVPKLHDVLRRSNGAPVEVTYRRAGEERTASIIPEKSAAGQGAEPRWMIGVQLEPGYVITQLPFPEAVRESVSQNLKSATLIYRLLEGIVERRMSAKSLEGPIRIAQISGEMAREGAAPFIGLMATVSLNLAVFNLLPIPILDGGVILMLLIEMIMRRDLSLGVKEAVVKVGFVFLMVLVVFVIYNDLAKVLPG
jgi:regulator of sigma E protease